ncbi:transglycosylase SLT domain-containing protein [Streptomyces sp. NEAU-W12]|uniref:transglycosylase SLT domain-containing protein n=1 Tax=Streptomyces sp. NEAU-W12 TaxID=2994668 RepID=UPI00224B4F18|nr:transglycosylase SLT domain-containing protein [Streptomyces sp. NEAU-W12]MCX2926393.1 transglycosylase SLT domain-containing protein [Streptomyces sp. NEAU-W12]
MTASGPPRHSRLVRSFAVAGVAAVALPLFGASTASAAPAAPATATAAPAAAGTVTAYPDNLDGWIRESLSVMAQHGIPGSYDSIHRNILRESSGNPQAINLWDSNAMAGTPSKGLLQVIDPTFQAYHVPGTAFDPFDPVANITAACNYAADRYGSIDNVFGAY